MNFATVEAVTLPDGSVKLWSCAGETLWEKVAGRIPAEYQEVEYVHMSTDAYINTQWRPSNMVLINVGLKTTLGSYPFGIGNDPRLAAHQTNDYLQIYNAHNGAAGLHNFHSIRPNIVGDIEIFVIEKSNDAYVIGNGAKIANGFTANQYPVKNADFSGAAADMFLGAWQYNASTLRTGNVDFYYFKASKNGVPELELVPCYRKSDGEIGMYDVVRKIFLTNAGTGSFTKGPDIA